MEMPVSSLTGLTLKDLLDAGLHFGHQSRRWNPKMRRYIFAKRNGIHIIDLTQSVPMLDKAAAFLRDTVLSGKKVIFVATKKQMQEVIKEAATACDQHYMTERWLGGTLTNNQTIRRSIKRMRQIEAIGRNNNGVLSVHKKEAASLRRELDKLTRNLGGVAEMDAKPGAMVVIDVCREQNAVAEARALGIPVVALVDTNADPDPVQYVIPCNDDSARGVKLIMDALAQVIKGAEAEYSRVATEKQRIKDAEQSAQEAQERATRKARRESAGAAASGEAAKAKLAETRKRAAKTARDSVAAKVAAATAADNATESLPETNATPPVDSTTSEVEATTPASEPAEHAPETESTPLDSTETTAE